MPYHARILLLVSIIGMVCAGIISVSVIFSIIYLSVRDGSVPEILNNYGGIIIGFFFGQFFSFIQTSLVKKDYSDDVEFIKGTEK